MEAGSGLKVVSGLNTSMSTNRTSSSDFIEERDDLRDGGEGGEKWGERWGQGGRGVIERGDREGG